MKTSVNQFETMVDFMERNGDLNKPADGPHGRLRNLRLWQELVQALNLDVTGDAKSLEKWKKVWSDYKSNLKKKAAKINQEVRGTGGGPSSRSVLSDLEQRVINIMGPQSVTGLNNVPEVGFEITQPPTEISAGPSQLSSTQTISQYSQESSFNDIQIILQDSPNNVGIQIAGDADGTMGRLTQSPPLSRYSPSASPILRLPLGLPCTDGPTISQPHRLRTQNAVVSGSPVHHPRPQSPSPRMQSQLRSRSPLRTDVTHTPRPSQRPRRSTRRPSTPPPPPPLRDEVAMRFEEQDERWRLIVRELAAENFRIRERELEEQTRLRERELQQQAVWQELFGKCIDLLTQFLSKK